jgi:hypothetical protein
MSGKLEAKLGLKHGQVQFVADVLQLAWRGGRGHDHVLCTDLMRLKTTEIPELHTLQFGGRVSPHSMMAYLHL